MSTQFPEIPVQRSFPTPPPVTNGQGQPFTQPAQTIDQARQQAESGRDYGQSLRDCLMLELQVCKITLTRKVPVGDVEVDADKSLLGVNKRILDCAEFKAIDRLDSQTKEWIGRRAIPSRFRAGCYAVPVVLFDEIERKLAEYQAERQIVVDRFLAVYDDAISEAQERLRAVFNPTDYPPKAKLARMFSVRWQYLMFSTPDRLKTLNRAVWERERSKIEEQWKQAAAEVTGALRTTMQELVAHLYEKLQPGEDGKKKVIRSSSYEKFQDFLAYFRDRNVTGDSELSALVARAQDLTRGVDMNTLKTNDFVRADLERGLEGIRNELDAMIGSAPARVISFGDE